MRNSAPYERPLNLDLSFQPRLKVTIVIPARGNQEKVDLTLAALALQSYPQRLTRTIVIDDASEPALVLPKLKPKNSELVRFAGKSLVWGKTRAINQVASSIKSDVIWFLDSDMVTDPDHLAHHMKWHHHSSEYIVLGWKRFVGEWKYNSDNLTKKLTEGAFASLHQESFPHEYFESRMKATKDLRNPGLDGFRTLVGATFSMRTTTWRELGGYNEAFTTGEDTELGWRALMHGFTLVPEPAAKSWHLGLTTFTANSETMFSHNNPNLANWIPELRHLRTNREVVGPLWQVPDQHLIIDCRNISLDTFNYRVQKFIRKGGQSSITLLADWKSLDHRYSPLNDDLKELRAIRNWYQGDPRIEFAQVPAEKTLTIEEILNYCPIGSTPYSYFCEPGIDEDLDFSMLKTELTKKGFGLVGTVDDFGYRAFAVFTPALARAHRHDAKHLYSGIDQLWGVRWESIERIKKNDERKIAQMKSLATYSLIRISKIRSAKDLKSLVRRAFTLVRG